MFREGLEYRADAENKMMLTYLRVYVQLGREKNYNRK